MINQINHGYFPHIVKSFETKNDILTVEKSNTKKKKENNNKN